MVTTAIGQDRPIPIHELVQAAKMFDHIQPGPDEQVICVAQNDLCMKLAQFLRTNPFHGALCSDRHKHRRIEHAMSRCYPAAARFRFAILRNEFKHRESHSHIVQA